MQTSVHKVIVGKAFGNGSAESLNVGDVALFDQDRQLVDSEDKALKASSIYVGVVDSKFDFTSKDGVVTQKNNIEYSMEIKKGGHPTVLANSYQAPVSQQVTIDLTSPDVHIVAGHRYVIRIVYKDFEVNKYQVTHTYEVYAETDNVTDLVKALIAKINSHKNRRVTVSMVPFNAITLTAMPKSDNDGVNSLNEYSIVNMEVSFYKTIPGALLFNQPESVPGVVVKTVKEGKVGLGYWKQVRDAETRNMGYDGHVFTGAYPQIKRKLRTVEGTSYDQVLITSDNPYLSNDNQYIKTTPMTIEVYVAHQTGTLDTQTFVKCVKAFVTGKKAEEE